MEVGHHPNFRVAVDVGGTFMDFVILDEETGAIRIEKVPSLPDDLHDQLIVGLKRLAVHPSGIKQIFHGMTVGVNALVQENGARVGLVTTRGFRDVLEMGRGGRRPVYDFVLKHAPAMVDRLHRREVNERVTHKGEVLQPIDLDELDAEVDFLVGEGVEAIAIAFLHSYAFPDHERAAKERIKFKHPSLPVSVSHEIASEWREYERTSTTVLNSFIQPIVKGYLERLKGNLTQFGYDKPLAVMQSSGGVFDSIMAEEKPIRTLMSGPAGGVMGAKFLADRLGHRNVICTDVGGTTYDVALIEDGAILERGQMEIGGRPILGSLIDITSVGAGGGSIAWLDHRNALRVGPQSAGALPGPVCFNKGGVQPTVTDAHLLLGRLDPDYFLGGRMQLDVEAAKSAVYSRIAKPLDVDAIDAARGIVAITETNMANAIRSKTVERGLDPREFIMMAFGGGGGLFACSVADELGIKSVLVPVAPANFSAWGILTTDYRDDEVKTKVMSLDHRSLAEAIDTAEELEKRSVDRVHAYGFDLSAIEKFRRFDMRFAGQEYTVTVDLDPDWNSSDEILSGIRLAFVEAHRRLYGHGDMDAPLELVAVRCHAVGSVRAPRLVPPPASDPSPGRERKVWFGDSEFDTRIIDRASLAANCVEHGPLIIEEWTTTTVVPPGWAVALDEIGNLMLTNEEEV